MRKMKKALAAVAALSIMATAALGVGISFSASADASLNVNYKTEYAFGESLTVEKGEISVGGSKVEATATVVLPNGSTTTADKVKLDKEGTYSVVYSATVNGKEEKVVRTFTVKKDLFSVSSTASTLTSGGTYDTKDHNKAGLTNKYGYTVAGVGSVTGLQVALASGDTFNYNQVIDLTEKTRNDTLIEFAVTPEEIGSMDVKGFDIVLTDAYDPSEEMVIRVMAGMDTFPDDQAGLQCAGLYNGVSYLKAGFDGSLAGMLWWGNPPTGTLKTDESSGSIIILDFTGVGGDSQHYAAIKNIADNCISLSYDDLTKCLFPKKNGYYFTYDNEMVDFDSEDYFETPWDGFTTGECFLSVRAFQYEQSNFNFVVKEVDGMKVEDVKENRALHTIQVDTLGFAEDDLPDAVAGMDYRTFPATCVSPYYGELKVETKAYEGKGTDGKEIAVSETGRFRVSKEGVHTIAYSATDVFGRTATKLLYIDAVAESDPMILTLKGEQITQSTAGQVLTELGVGVEGAVGDYSLDVRIESDGETYRFENGKFRFPKAGTYVVTYTAEDYLGRTATESYSIKVAKGDTATFVDPVYLPKYFVNGYTYEIPDVYAYDFTDGSASPVKAKAYLADKNGESLIRKGLATPQAEKHGDKVTVIFEATLNGKVSSVSYQVPVLFIESGEGGFTMEKLFYTVEGEPVYNVQEYDTDVTVKTNTVLDYINPVRAQGFEFIFAGNNRFAGCNQLSLTLTDYQNHGIAVEFRYTKEGGKTYFTVNGTGKQYEVKEGLTSGAEIALAYKAEKNAVSYSASSNVKVAIDKTLSGEAFNGFPSGRVYATISVDGVRSSTRFTLKKLANQAICDITYCDYNAPQFGSLKDYGGLQKLGSVVTLDGVFAADAIEPWVDVVLTVTDAEGNYVTAADGTLLNEADGSKVYDVKLEKYGSYIVDYTGVDSCGNDAGLTYLLTVINDEAPVMTKKGDMPATGKVGEKLVLPTWTAQDDLDGDVQVQSYVITDQGQIVVLQGNALIPATAGRYTVYCWCVDSSGNMASESFTITVNE